MGWKVVRLNELGMKEYSRRLGRIRSGKEENWPSDLINGKGKNAKFTEPLPRDVELRLPTKHMTKNELAERIIEDFSDSYPDITETFGDSGLWAALSCAIPQIWKKGTKPRVDEKYIPEGGYDSYYRHSLMNICWIRSNHGEHGRVLLVGDTHKFTEAQEQIAAAPIMNQEAIWELMDKLYLRIPPQKIPPSGWKEASGLTEGKIHYLTRGKGPASFRGLKKYIRKLSMTWDLKSLDSEELIALLDGRFDPLFET